MESGARQNQHLLAAEIAGLDKRAQKIRDEMALREKRKATNPPAWMKKTPPAWPGVT